MPCRKLDVLHGNDKRADLLVAPGDLRYQRSGRTFEAEPTVREFVHTALVHDADGDGHADELVIARGGCIYLPLEGQYAREDAEFCKERPRGTNAIYKYRAGAAHLISPNIDPEAPLLVYWPHGKEPPSYIEGSFASGIVSADWDQDGRADLAIAMPDRVDFYLSAGRPAGVLPGVSVPTHSVKLDVPVLRLRERDETVVAHETIIQEFGGVRVETTDQKQKPQKPNVFASPSPSLSPSPRVWTKLASEDENAFDIANHYMIAKDFDLDGEVELVVAESTGVLVLKFDGKKWLTTREAYPKGTDASRALGAADLNNDGYIDLLVSSEHGLHVLLAQQPKTARRFVAVTLQGTQANAYGIGATVVLWASGMGPCRKVRSQLREVQTHGYGVHQDGGSTDYRLVFGLGEHGVPLNLTVRWPGPMWAVQVISGASLSEAVGSTVDGQGLEQMRRPLVVTEPI